MTEDNAYDKKPEDDLLAKQQKFHAGISVYGPNMSDKFRGAIMINGSRVFAEDFDSFDEARDTCVEVFRSKMQNYDSKEHISPLDNLK